MWVSRVFDHSRYSDLYVLTLSCVFGPQVDMPLDDCVRLIEEYEPCPTVKAQHMLALDG